MDGAGGGLGHDVTVPGSHVIIGEPGIILYSSHDMTPTVSKDVRIVLQSVTGFLVVNNLTINVLFPHTRSDKCSVLTQGA